MPRPLLRRIACSAILACAIASCAQTPALSSPAADPRSFDATAFGEPVTLGPDWLFAAGDNPAWASPSFDDSAWRTISANKNLEDYGIRNSAFAWYRMHIQLRPGAHNLTVGTRNVSGRYEIFANGVRIGVLGDGSHAIAQNGLRAFAIPDQILPGQDLVLAFRFAVNRAGSMGRGSSTPLGPYSVSLLGPDSAAFEASYFATHSAGPVLLACLLALIVCLIAGALYSALRRNHEYLAISILLLAASTHAALVAFMNLSVLTTAAFAAMYLALAVENFALIEFVRLVLGLRRGPWLLALEIVSSLTFVLNGIATMGFVSFSPLFFLLVIIVPVQVAKIVLPVLLIRGGRAGNREAMLLLPAIFIGCFADYMNFVRQIASHFHIAWLYPYLGFNIKVGSYYVDLWRIGDYVFYIALLLFLVLRTVRIARERALASAELLAARTVQQVLIPAVIPSVPGFRIGSVYYPAGQVGGDFFQILPLPNGGVIAVIGDVSGKGMPAAMTVSLLVGTVRTLVHFTESPAAILAAMNQRMLNRSSGGFTTCLVARAAADGALTIANAGHIPPFLDGVELPTENGLPLGLSADSTYAEANFRLGPNQQLTLLTDGVVEARDKSGALLGFERSAALSIQPAEAIAQAAQSFGQDDDITVLTMCCSAVPAPAPAG